MGNVGVRVVAKPASAPTTSNCLAQIDAAIGQASLILNDRVKILLEKCPNVCANLPEPLCFDLCEIADDLAKVSYHVMKWRAFLGGGKMLQKPLPSEDPDMAIATLHFTVPRLMMNVGEVLQLYEPNAHHRGMNGLSNELQRVAPHLECLIARLNRLVTDLETRSSICHTIPCAS